MEKSLESGIEYGRDESFGRHIDYHISRVEPPFLPHPHLSAINASFAAMLHQSVDIYFRLSFSKVVRKKKTKQKKHGLFVLVIRILFQLLNTLT